jgi:hypothetical protein
MFDECEVAEQPELEEVKAPEPLKRVKVLDPFSVSHDGTAYWPNAVAEIPASVAKHWLSSNWVVEEEED